MAAQAKVAAKPPMPPPPPVVEAERMELAMDSLPWPDGCAWVQTDTQADVQLAPLRRKVMRHVVATSKFFAMCASDSVEERRMAACFPEDLEQDPYINEIQFASLSSKQCICILPGPCTIETCEACQRLYKSNPRIDSACIVCGQG